MTNELQKKLERLANRSTAYELAAIHPDGRRVLIAYSRKGRRGIFSAVRNRGEAVAALCQSQEFAFAKRAADGATCGEWSIRFTGRTQRDAYVEGELTYVGDL